MTEKQALNKHTLIKNIVNEWLLPVKKETVWNKGLVIGVNLVYADFFAVPYGKMVVDLPVSITYTMKYDGSFTDKNVEGIIPNLDVSPYVNDNSDYYTDLEKVLVKILEDGSEGNQHLDKQNITIYTGKDGERLSNEAYNQRKNAPKKVYPIDKILGEDTFIHLSHLKSRIMSNQNSQQKYMKLEKRLLEIVKDLNENKGANFEVYTGGPILTVYTKDTFLKYPIYITPFSMGMKKDSGVHLLIYDFTRSKTTLERATRATSSSIQEIVRLGGNNRASDSAKSKLYNEHMYIINNLNLRKKIG